MTTPTNIKEEYQQLITSSRYNYFLSLVFKDFDNLNTDKQLKTFLKHLHRKLFGRRYIKQNKLLKLVIVQEHPFQDSPPHYHILISTYPHHFNYNDLVTAVVYAINACPVIRSIRTKEIPLLKTNHFKAKDNPVSKILKKIQKEQQFFPYNVVPIDTEEDHERITRYILKDCVQNNFPIAFNEPDRDNYFNFTTRIA